MSPTPKPAPRRTRHSLPRTNATHQYTSSPTDEAVQTLPPHTPSSTAPKEHPKTRPTQSNRELDRLMSSRFGVLAASQHGYDSASSGVRRELRLRPTDEVTEVEVPPERRTRHSIGSIPYTGATEEAVATTSSSVPSAESEPHSEGSNSIGPPKRPRGRPRKSAPTPLASGPNAPPAPKRPRGRPRKNATALPSAPPPTKLPVGRPRNSDPSPVEPPKRPRGRPRKDATTLPSVPPSGKRPVGRPRNSDSSPVEPPKRPRGRPRKSDPTPGNLKRSSSVDHEDGKPNRNKRRVTSTEQSDSESGTRRRNGRLSPQTSSTTNGINGGNKSIDDLPTRPWTLPYGAPYRPGILLSADRRASSVDRPPRQVQFAQQNEYFTIPSRPQSPEVHLTTTNSGSSGPNLRTRIESPNKSPVRQYDFRQRTGGSLKGSPLSRKVSTVSVDNSVQDQPVGSDEASDDSDGSLSPNPGSHLVQFAGVRPAERTDPPTRPTDLGPASSLRDRTVILWASGVPSQQPTSIFSDDEDEVGNE